MRALLLPILSLGVAASAWAQPKNNVVLAAAKFVISPTPFHPGDQLTLQVSFRQGLAFASLGGIACSSPTSAPAPCDSARSLKIDLWRDNVSGVRAAQPLTEVVEAFEPPAFYTLVNRSFSAIAVPRVDPPDYLTIELIFVDKYLKPEGSVYLSVAERPRVLGSRVYRLTCRPPRRGTPEECRYADASP